MFSGKKKERMAADTSLQQNSIAKGTVITGDVIGEGDFRIEGTIHGTIQTPGKVVIGKTGVVSGTLKSANADIEGQFSGQLFLTNMLALKSSAAVEGEVEVGRLAVEPGATFNATCVMKGAVKELPSKNGQGKQKSSRKEKYA